MASLSRVVKRLSELVQTCTNKVLGSEVNYTGYWTYSSITSTFNVAIFKEQELIIHERLDITELTYAQICKRIQEAVEKGLLNNEG